MTEQNKAQLRKLLAAIKPPRPVGIQKAFHQALMKVSSQNIDLYDCIVQIDVKLLEGSYTVQDALKSLSLCFQDIINTLKDKVDNEKLLSELSNTFANHGYFLVIQNDGTVVITAKPSGKKRWNGKAFEVNEKLDAFLAEIDEVCKKHNLSISHQNTDASLLIEEYKEANRETLENAIFVRPDESVVTAASDKPTYRLEGLIFIKTNARAKQRTWIRFSGACSNSGAVTLINTDVAEEINFRDSAIAACGRNDTWKTRIKKGLEQLSPIEFSDHPETVQENILYVTSSLLSRNVIRQGDVFRCECMDKFHTPAELYVMFFKQ